MAKHNQFMPLWVADYLVDVQDLTLEQSGAYLHLIMHYWRRGSPVPECERAQSKLLRIDVRKWRVLRPIVAPYFIQPGEPGGEPGVWRHRRVDAELAKAHARYLKAKNAADERARKNTGSARLRADVSPMSPGSLGEMVDEMPGDLGHGSLDLFEKKSNPSTAPSNDSRHAITTTTIEKLVVEGGNPPSLLCPVEEVVKLYHEVLPTNPRLRVLTEARRKSIAARWRECQQPIGRLFGYKTREEGLAAWRLFFEIVAESKFLTGRTSGTNGRPPFVASLEWLMQPSNFAKVIEDRYHREVG